MAELRHLRAFVAVAEELNFTRAAERLFVTQQTVSRAVAQLERELGVELLERTTHAVTLTAPGTALLNSGRHALAAVETALADARAIGRGLAGTIRVGVTPAVGSAVRMELARGLGRDGSASVAFREIRPDQVPTLLRDREVDLVLARTSRRLADVDSVAVTPTPATLLVPTGHRLAGTEPVRIAQLDGERLLTWNPPGTPYTDLLVSQLAAAGACVEPVQARITGGGDAPDLDGHRAVALLPRGWPAGDRAVEVPLAEAMYLPLLLLWRTGARTPAVERVRAALTSDRGA